MRYERRYNFQIVEGDQKRIRDAISQGVLNLISGQRIRNEIDHILSEEATPQIVHQMHDFNLFRAVHPAWEVSLGFNARWAAAGRAIEWASTYLPNDQINIGAIHWMTLLTHPDAIEVVSNRLALENQLQAKLIAREHLWCVLGRLSASSKPSEVYQLLNAYPLEPLVFTLTQSDQPGWRVEKIENYLTHLKDVQPLITGDDLIQQGLKPGRTFATLLQKVFAAQLDEQLSTKQEAYQFLGY
jgi:tRNA nucleotidyltransferase (CCA-adding enzyme)